MHSPVGTEGKTTDCVYSPSLVYDRHATILLSWGVQFDPLTEVLPFTLTESECATSERMAVVKVTVDIGTVTEPVTCNYGENITLHPVLDPSQEDYKMYFGKTILS